MNKINWGIIGCGNVTEIKSGPAFNKVENSSLVAVMRRNEGKVIDYALRHNVPKWYTDANSMINDPAVNAVYIATPPSTHEQYTLAAIAAGKHVYVEKPMAMNAGSARTMVNAANQQNGKLVIAHYRRAQPLFKKIKQLIDEHFIGEIKLARLEYYRKPLTKEELAVPKTAWRLDPLISGGGLFHDIAPHQLDLMTWFFGEVEKGGGISMNNGSANPDVVAGNILFKNGIVFNGLWCFSVEQYEEKDLCEIIGSEGKISFPIFEHKEIKFTKNNQNHSILFEPLKHVQQPMIEKTVDYFLDQGPNPCSGEEGVKVMELLDVFTGKYSYYK